jgi:chromate reductase, NAD(P)H dehydrogenase (quinone)
MLFEVERRPTANQAKNTDEEVKVMPEKGVWPFSHEHGLSLQQTQPSARQVNPDPGVMQVLAISGSLRVASVNSAFCRVAARLAPASMVIAVFTGLGDLPLFNPDLEALPPLPVKAWLAAVANADALIIASPEYAHGVSGAMKNALDWLVSFEGAVGKPVALVNTSPRAHHAYDALQEILKTMSMHRVAEASVTLPLLGASTSERQMFDAPELTQSIQSALDALAAFLSGGATQVSSSDRCV